MSDKERKSEGSKQRVERRLRSRYLSTWLTKKVRHQRSSDTLRLVVDHYFKGLAELQFKRGTLELLASRAHFFGVSPFLAIAWLS